MRQARDAIRDRHAADDNTSTHLLSDDPREVLAYLRRRGVRELRGDTTGHDVVDGLTLRIYLWWEGERTEVWLMQAGVTLGLTGKTIGAPLGVRSRAGLMKRIEYKLALIAADTVDDTAADTQSQAGRTKWLADHRDELLAIAGVLVKHWDLFGEDTLENLVEVRSDWRAGTCNPESFAYLDWAIDDVAVDPAIAGLAADHPLRELLTRWPRLLAAYPPADKENAGT
jgi:hypothetical protein